MPTLAQPARRIGLALSGGAVRGAAHVGVLDALFRAGIRPDMVAGTSVGALVGAGVAAGLPPSELERIFLTVRWPGIARIAIRDRFLGLLDARPLERRLIEAIGRDTIEALELPFAAVACDLLTGERVVFREGPLGPALRASSAVPGIFPPVEHGGRVLVDGCVVDNLPVDVVRDMGADYVIAVDLIPPPSGRRRPRNVLEVLMIAGYLWSRANHPSPDAVDCLVVPDVADSLGWDFADVPGLIVAGREAAEAALPRLCADLGLA